MKSHPSVYGLETARVIAPLNAAIVAQIRFYSVIGCICIFWSSSFEFHTKPNWLLFLRLLFDGDGCSLHRHNENSYRKATVTVLVADDHLQPPQDDFMMIASCLPQPFFCFFLVVSFFFFLLLLLPNWTHPSSTRCLVNYSVPMNN